jgi:hypothetical protein
MNAHAFAIKLFRKYRETILTTEQALTVFIEAAKGTNPQAAAMHPNLFDPKIEPDERDRNLAHTVKAGVDTIRTTVRQPLLRRLAFVLNIPLHAEKALFINCETGDIPWAESHEAAYDGSEAPDEVSEQPAQAAVVVPGLEEDETAPELPAAAQKKKKKNGSEASRRRGRLRSGTGLQVDSIVDAFLATRVWE